MFLSALPPFFIFSLGTNVCTRVALLTSACTCRAHRHGLGDFLADCLQPLEARCGDRLGGGGGGCLKISSSALILLIRPGRCVAFPRNYLHTVNLSLGGRSKANPTRHEAIWRREGRRGLRCRLIREGESSQDNELSQQSSRRRWKSNLAKCF